VLAPIAATRPALSAPRGGDDRRPAVRGQLDEHAPGHAASAVHQHGLPGADLECVADHLVGGQRRDRQRRDGLERCARRQDGHILGGGDVLLGPGALLTQRSRVHSHPAQAPKALVTISRSYPRRGRLALPALRTDGLPCARGTSPSRTLASSTDGRGNALLAFATLGLSRDPVHAPVPSPGIPLPSFSP
jgi:hypothetical protein